MVRRIAMKFDVMTHFDPLKPSDGQKFHFLKPRWRTADARNVRGRCTLFIYSLFNMHKAAQQLGL